jgi:uncharacterized phage protein gp47/JayE
MRFFVDNAQTIFTLAGALILYIYHIAAQHIPAQQRAYIEKWAAVAVATAEQQYAGKSNEEKKAIAMDEVKAFFKAFNLPLPSDDILGSFIEAAVNALPSTEPPTQPQIRRASL